MRYAATTIALAVMACGTNASPAVDGGDFFAGEWEMEFTLDSVPGPDDRRVWVPRDAPPVRGTLSVSGSRDDREAYEVTMTVDFRPLLGRQMSCYEPGRRTIRIARADSASWSLLFTPAAADCGFGASARRQGDTLRGEWSETSFIGPVARGRLLMSRR